MEIYNNMSEDELIDFLKSIGEKPYRGKQFFEAIHKNQVNSVDEITTFSKKLREKLKSKGEIQKLEILDILSSKLDETKKFILECWDGNIIEAVYMESHTYTTLCISTQIGCKMGCVFCASTKERFSRNLETYEMVDQIYTVANHLGKRIDNLVLMGIGEPLDNYDNVIKFIRTITDKKGYDLSVRAITLSTCGIVPKIYQLADENIPINIAISLHNPFNEERKKIMPMGKKYSIDEILDATDYFFSKTGRRISFEYTLIENVNDSKKYSDQIIRLLKGKNVFVNLISLNEIEEYKEKALDMEKSKAFRDRLNHAGIQASIRRKQGQDIEGACGQLRSKYINSERSGSK